MWNIKWNNDIHTKTSKIKFTTHIPRWNASIFCDFYEQWHFQIEIEIEIRKMFAFVFLIK